MPSPLTKFFSFFIVSRGVLWTSAPADRKPLDDAVRAVAKTALDSSDDWADNSLWVHLKSSYNLSGFFPDTSFS